MSRDANAPYDEEMRSSERPNERIDEVRERAANQFGSTMSQAVTVTVNVTMPLIRLLRPKR